MTKKYHHASYWQYTGNHPDGKDCEQYDPHGYGLQVISILYYLYQIETLSGTAIVTVHNQDNFGRIIKIKADIQAWEYAKKFCEFLEG